MVAVASFAKNIQAKVYLTVRKNNHGLLDFGAITGIEVKIEIIMV